MNQENNLCSPQVRLGFSRFYLCFQAWLAIPSRGAQLCCGNIPVFGFTAPRLFLATRLVGADDCVVFGFGRMFHPRRCRASRFHLRDGVAGNDCKWRLNASISNWMCLLAIGRCQAAVFSSQWKGICHLSQMRDWH